ncbi:MAG: hypothetical protein ACOYL6_04050 [Bacteriovoracaceae bacterium]
MSRDLLNLIEEQVVVEFSGKINLLLRESRQLLGSIILNEGEIFRVDYKGNSGMKALFSLYLDDLKDNYLSIVVEPEIIENVNRNLHYPFKTIMMKLSEFMHEYEKNKSLRPPDGIKLLAVADFLASGGGINEKEFQVLATISDYNKIEEIYRYCPLMEYEITQSLITLRQKGALKVIKGQA